MADVSDRPVPVLSYEPDGKRADQAQVFEPMRVNFWRVALLVVLGSLLMALLYFPLMLVVK